MGILDAELTELDPVTPPAFGRQVAQRLSKSYFYELPGGGHGGESTTPCALQVTAAFIDDPMSAPDASCIAEMPGLVFDVPREVADVQLEPFTNSELGISGVAPAGWTEVQPGLYVRASSGLGSTLDVAAMQVAVGPVADVQTVADNIAKGYGLTAAPEPTSERQANGLTWSLYALAVQDTPRDLGLAESEAGVLIVLLRSAPEEREALYETLFLPAVDALVPLVEEE